jgi:hypothetical protein
MEPVKINLYISYTPEDKPYLEKLLSWLYPMRDEVNIFFNSPPPGAEPLALPWQLLLFWYRLPDARRSYKHILKHQLERAHIYLFLTSYKSLASRVVEDEITTAVNRHIQLGDRYLRIFPVIVAPCRWQEKSRLGRYKPIGPKKPLSAMSPQEDGFLQLTDQLALVIQELKRNLDEWKYGATTGSGKALGSGNYKVQPDVGEDIATLLAEPEPEFRPPEWLGWVILIGLVVLTMGSLGRKLPTSRDLRFRNAEPAEKRPPEYHRENPMVPPPKDMPLPPEDK